VFKETKLLANKIVAHWTKKRENEEDIRGNNSIAINSYTIRKEKGISCFLEHYLG
jgi:hypothetical protein